MTEIALITDTHAGCRNNSLEHVENQRLFFDNVFFPYLEKNNIQTVIHLGDTFDRRKEVQFQILHKWKEMYFNKIKKYDYHQILGNHDTFFKNTNDVNSVELLLSEYGRVYTNTTDINIDGTNITLVPWISEDIHDETLEKISKSKALYLFGHLDIQGFEMAGGKRSEYGLNQNTFNHFDLVLSGHFHKKSMGGNVTYLGTPYQWSWEDDGQTKGFHTLDLKTAELKFIENPYTMYETLIVNENDDVKSLIKKVEGKYVRVHANITNENVTKYEKILSKLEDFAIDIGISHTKVEKTAKTIVLSDDFSENISNYVKENQNIDIDDKKEVTEMLQSIYTEVTLNS